MRTEHNMRAGEIWWRRIGHSIRFTEDMASAMEEDHGIILNVPANMPWKDDFYEIVNEKWHNSRIDRRLERLEWRETGKSGRAEKDEVGKFVLKKLCPPKVVANYFPGRSCASYLGRLNDLSMNNSYIWVTNICTRESLQKWVSFVREYESCAQSLNRMAVFILEYTGEPVNFDGVPQLRYHVEECHCRVFCLEMLEMLEKNMAPWMRNYMTELILRNSPEDPELCEQMIRQGEGLLQHPEDVLTGLLQSRSKKSLTELRSEIINNTREAMMVFLFPLLERCRVRFVARHNEALAACLPMQNPIGDPINVPQDLEWGPLWWLAGRNSRLLPQEEMRKTQLCRDLRNDLAHAANYQPIAFERICRFMEYAHAELGRGRM